MFPNTKRSNSGSRNRPGSGKRTGRHGSEPESIHGRGFPPTSDTVRLRTPLVRASKPNAYLFGAICRARGTGAALALPFADTQAMQLHLNEISRHIARGAHADLLLDRAGLHTTEKLKLPKALTLIFLPSCSPELKPVENIWQYLRANWFSNRVFDNYDAIIDAACDAWNRLMDQPHTIKSIGSRKCVHIGQCKRPLA